MEENPLFTDQIRNAVEQLRARRLRPEDPRPPMLHTWAQQVAWERLRAERAESAARAATEAYDRVVYAVWQWIGAVNDGIGLGTEDLANAMNESGAPCPEDLNEGE